MCSALSFGINVMAESRAHNRLDNIPLVLSAAGSMARFAREYGFSYTHLMHLRNKQRPLTAEFAREIERAVGLPSGWMDASQNALPAAVARGIQARASKPAGDDEMARRRLQNVYWLVGEQRGAKARFCARVGWAESRFQHMAVRAFGPLKARNLESKLKLPQGWLDQEHPHVELPQEFDDRLACLLERYTPAAAVPAAAVPAAVDQRIESPVVRALLEKLTALAVANRVPELKALQLLNEVMEIERE